MKWSWWSRLSWVLNGECPFKFWNYLASHRTDKPSTRFIGVIQWIVNQNLVTENSANPWTNNPLVISLVLNRRALTWKALSVVSTTLNPILGQDHVSWDVVPMTKFLQRLVIRDIPASIKKTWNQTCRVRRRQSSRERPAGGQTCDDKKSCHISYCKKGKQESYLIKEWMCYMNW